MAPVRRMQGLLSGECRLQIDSCLENAGCILAPVWRMQAVYWLLSGECRLYIGSCLENAGCILAHVWRMQAVYWLLSGLILGNVAFLALEFLIKPMGVEVLNGSCLENAGCILALVWRMQAVTWFLCGVCPGSNFLSGPNKLQAMFVTLVTQTKQTP